MNTGLRLLWLLLAVLGLGLFLALTPAYLQALRTPFTGGELQLTDWFLLRPAEMQGLQEFGLSPGFYAGYFYTFEVLWRALWCGSAALVFWRKFDDRMGRLVAFMLMTVGLFVMALPSINSAVNYSALRLLVALLAAVGPALVVFFAYLFPDGRFVPSWPAALSNALLTALVAFGIAVSLSFGVLMLLFGLFVGSLAIALLAQIYRYRHVSTPVERQQTRWVLFGVLASVVSNLLVLVYLAFYPSLLSQPSHLPALFIMALLAVIVLGTVPIPLTISLSILRYRLWDIDIIIRRSLIYGALTVTLGVAYLVSVVALQAAFRRLTGQGDQLAIVASTLGIAALVGPVGRRIQKGIDRRFYRSKYDAEKVLAAFGATVREEVDLERLTGKLLAAVQETMQPEHVSLWLSGTSPPGPTPMGGGGRTTAGGGSRTRSRGSQALRE